MIQVIYEAPVVVDYGSIVEHTLTRETTVTCGDNDPPKDWRTCKLDKFCEWSCPS